MCGLENSSSIIFCRAVAFELTINHINSGVIEAKMDKWEAKVLAQKAESDQHDAEELPKEG